MAEEKLGLSQQTYTLEGNNMKYFQKA